MHKSGLNVRRQLNRVNRFAYWNYNLESSPAESPKKPAYYLLRCSGLARIAAHKPPLATRVGAASGGEGAGPGLFPILSPGFIRGPR